MKTRPWQYPEHHEVFSVSAAELRVLHPVLQQALVRYV